MVVAQLLSLRLYPADDLLTVKLAELLFVIPWYF